MKTPAVFQRRLTQLERIAAETQKQRERAKTSEVVKTLMKIFSLQEVSEVIALAKREGTMSLIPVVTKPEYQHLAVIQKVRALIGTSVGRSVGLYSATEEASDDVNAQRPVPGERV